MKMPVGLVCKRKVNIKKLDEGASIAGGCAFSICSILQAPTTTTTRLTFASPLVTIVIKID
ncbi:hypothetical protein T4E_11004 [Trichinella pseudospiralis]|uniref:Uncharacterized protein n=1 Tax=Trichinella pseudospiralis TaxID=6337 RepID=A0A0V0YPC8_TRIPS|nr:hypothetical protein T4E_11004 [Trichinella pseudospiralis]